MIFNFEDSYHYELIYSDMKTLKDRNIPLSGCDSEEYEQELGGLLALVLYICSQSPENSQEWMENVASSQWNMLTFLSELSPLGCSGKMSPEFCQPTADGILENSSERWLSAGIASHTECWTLSFSEYPNAAVESSSSAILETGDLPQRYFLSRKACLGILRRAEKRGRELPLLLKAALQNTLKAAED